MVNQQSEDILDPDISLLGVVLLPGSLRLVIHQLVFALGLTASLTIHYRGVLVHEGIALSVRVGLSTAAILVGEEAKEWILGWLPVYL